jgi:hypothetical protein
MITRGCEIPCTIIVFALPEAPAQAIVIIIFAVEKSSFIQWLRPFPFLSSFLHDLMQKR